MEREISVANHCPLDRPLIQEQPIDQEPMKPVLSSPETYQTAIANAKSKREAIEIVIKCAIEKGGLYSNQDILDEGVREKFREMMGRLP